VVKGQSERLVSKPLAAVEIWFVRKKRALHATDGPKGQEDGLKAGRRMETVGRGLSRAAIETSAAIGFPASSLDGGDPF
jgi:hypothetical protein